MKKYNRTAFILAMILSLSTFSACSKVSDDDDLNNNETVSVTEDTFIGEGEATLSENAELQTTISTVDGTTGDANLIISESSTASDVNSTTTVTSKSENVSTSTSSSSVVPVDGNASKGKVVESISLSKNSITIAVGESEMPIVTMYPTDADDKSEIWSSSNSQVATVDNKGNITGISEGTCTVTVKAKANTSVYAEISVTVTAKKETSSNSTNGVTEPTYVQGVLIANKTYALPSDYNPYNGDIAPEVQEAFNKMQKDAAAEGLNLYISSGFRSYDYQAGLYERYASRDGYDMADTYSARAGHSEHQTGLAFDLNTIDDSFANTPEGIWVAENCYKYGFIIRFPKGKEDKTGYQYEPWHLRYLGVDLATKVYNSGLCLEEYLGITSQYAD